MSRTKLGVSDVQRARDQSVFEQRFELHPGTDLWMRGARYGQIVGVKKNGRLVVEMDKLPGRRMLFAPDRVTFLEGSGRFGNPTSFSNPFGCNC